MSTTCSGCGARLGAGVTQCDLCGAAVGDEIVLPVAPVAEPVTPVAVPVAPVAAAPSSASVFCTQCGWENPTASRFCAQCGAALVVAPLPKGRIVPAVDPVPASAAPVPAAKVEDSSAVGKRLGLIFGLALLVIVGFFLIDAASGDQEVTREAPLEQSAGLIATSDQPLSAELAERTEALRGEASTLSGEARLLKLREIVDLLAAAGRFDKAGAEQEAIAAETGSEDDWIRAGNLYYDWMDVHEGAERTTFAKATIAAYRKVLELNPENHDVRTDMAVAYMSDPDNPMLAIQENAAVLQADSLHVQANFNRGIMLLQINRIDGAIAQFEKVQRIVGNPDDPMYKLAEQALISVRQQAPVAPAN